MSSGSGWDPVLEAHRDRWARLDPWLPLSAELPAPRGDDYVLDCPGGRAIGRIRRMDLDSLDVTWTAATRYVLLARAADAAGLDALLTQWDDLVARLAPPGERDAEVTLTWPSRDTEMTRVLVAHGLCPRTVLAARPAGRSSPPAVAAVRDLAIRPLTPADIDAAAELWAETIRWDMQFGAGMAERASTKPNIRKELAAAAGDAESWTWLAEMHGESVGLLMLSPPEQAGWVAPTVALAPAGYLGCMGVTASHRGSGLGAALARKAHELTDAAGVRVVLLHYAALNPLSGPYWHRCGYRPLMTEWTRPPHR